MLITLGRGISPPRSLQTQTSLKAVVPSAVCDLDVTRADSYPGSGQQWFNLVTSPTDGSARSSYNLTLGDGVGASTDDPTFIGSAGQASAYFLLDGGDVFRIASNTAFINAMHKTAGGTDFWAAFAYRLVNAASSRNLFATNASSTNIGLRLSILSSNGVTVFQRGNAATVNSSFSGVSAGVNGQDCVLIISYSHVTQTVRYWINGAAGLDRALVFDTTSASASGRLSIGASSASTGALPSGTRFYACAFGNSTLTDTQAAAIASVYETRHARNYTP